MKKDDLIEHFKNEEKDIRFQLEFVLSVLEKNGFFKEQLSVPKRYFCDRAQDIYYEADTEIEFEAIQKGLWYCYERALEKNPFLQAPPRLKIVRGYPPLINEKSARIGDIQKVLDYAITNLSSENKKEHAISIAILLAKQINQISPELLFGNCQVLAMKDANKVFLNFGDSEKSIILDPVGLLLWRELKRCVPNASELNKYIRDEKPNYVEINGGLNELFCAFSMLYQPVFCQELLNVTSSLSADAMVASLSGQPLPEKFKEELPHNRKKKWETELIKTDLNFEKIAFGCRPFDAEAISELNFYLRRFKDQQANEKRNTKYIKECRDSLEKISVRCQDDCSATCIILVNYIINIFLHGTQWTEKLAVNSVLKYLSTLKQYCLNVCYDEDLLQSAQVDEESLSDLTQLAEDYLSSLPNDRQGTILLFLQYVSEHIPIRYINGSLEYAVKRSSTRIHYLPPGLFEYALVKIHNEQMLWYLQICYYCGLRDDECESLKVSDVTPDFLYVTRCSKRKTHAAIRRVSLMFMPKDLRLKFKEFAEFRGQYSEKLFDSDVLNFYKPSAKEELRKISNNQDFVFYSLRHCYANNALFALVIAAHGLIILREKYVLFRHEIFCDETIDYIKGEFIKVGCKLSEYTSIMNFLSVQMGHSSPVITAASYIHFLPLIAHELNSGRLESLEVKQLLALLPNNNYKYTQCDFYEKNKSESYLFKIGCHGLKKTSLEMKVASKISLSEKFNFFHFISNIYDALISNRNILFKSFSQLPSIKPERLFLIMNKSGFMNIVEKVSLIDWKRKNVSAVIFLSDYIFGDVEISSVRAFYKVLYGASILGFTQLEAFISSSEGSGNKFSVWESAAEKFGCKLYIEIKNTKNLKLERLRKNGRKLEYISEILEILKCYLELGDKK